MLMVLLTDVLAPGGTACLGKYSPDGVSQPSGRWAVGKCNKQCRERPRTRPNKRVAVSIFFNLFCPIYNHRNHTTRCVEK